MKTRADLIEFYDGLSVCVIGGAGMVGHVLVRDLLSIGARVTVLDNFSRGQNRISGANYITGDAANAATVKYAMRGGSAASRAFKVDAVFNLAATVAGVLYNVNHHLEMLHSNVNVLTVPVMVADSLGIDHYLQTSSVCVYDPEYNHPSTEEDGLYGEPHHANAGYAWAKRIGEYAVLMSNLPHAVIVRPSNIYGEGDYFDARAHVIPALMRRVKESDGSSLTIYGTPDTVREFVYSEDVSRGMLRALAFGMHKFAYNIGSDNCNLCTVRMDHLVKKVIEVGGGPDLSFHFTGQNSGDNLRWSDGSAAAEEIKFTHSVHLDEGLGRVWAWAEADGKI